MIAPPLFCLKSKINNMDDKLTEEIQEYLNQKPSERNVLHGAEMVLKLNRNIILFQNIQRNPTAFADKVVYELGKFLKMRLDRKTVEEVVRMEASVVPAAVSTLMSQEDEQGKMIISTDEDTTGVPKIAKGKRADHDDLPSEIQDLWNKNGELYFNIKNLFEQLKSMSNAPACDRYEYLKQLDDADKTYRANMAKYDSYKNDGSDFDDIPSSDTDPADIVKKVNAARKYLSSNKTKLAELRNSDAEAYAALLSKMQVRFDYLIDSGNSIEDSQVKDLVSLGVVSKATAPSADSSPAPAETDNESNATEAEA